MLISDGTHRNTPAIQRAKVEAEFGAVSALSVNHDCSRLLCGFAKGQITMWDLANGKLLRTITDAHPPGTTVLHVKVLVNTHYCMSRRVMGMWSCDSRCLFSGSKGEVCCIEPLQTPPDLRDHHNTPYSLLAMGALIKIGLKPSLKVWMTFPYNKDPVYGKGKLSEIQGLILGMLDTFNYEQTLLETTTSLLNHDLHWSLAHLRASVTRGLVPRQDTCNICLLQYRRRHDPPEEIVIFSCGHLYHCQCLQAKDCGSGSGSERPQQWSCFKCSSNQGGRGGAMADQRRARSTSLAQPGLEAHGKKLFVEATLDPQQAQSWDHLRCLYHGPSRLAILSELTHCHGNENSGLLHPAPQGTGSVFHSEDFKLKLSPPPAVEE
ncbi:unnamed protein product [Gadus morhua 'NCC']